jgi:anti-sigma-K factor RskA
MDPTMSHAELEQLAAGYVLGALEPDDEQAFSRHLGDCQLCQAEVGELESVVGDLAYAVPQVEPPKALRSAIRREVGLTGRRRGLLSLRLPSSPFLPRLAVAFSLVAVLVLGFWNFSLRNELALEHRRQELIEQALQVAAAPSGQVELASTGGSSARATLLVREDTAEGALIVSQMPDLPKGKVWQFWVVPPGKDAAEAQPGRIWVSGEAAAAVPLGKLPMFTGASFAVTDEPSGGSPHPTGRIVIQGTQGTA